MEQKQFNELIKDIFSGNNKPEKRIIHISIGFAKAIRKEYGDKKFYDFLHELNIYSGEECCNYLTDFITEYESKMSPTSQESLI